jgi:hypothetical protein
MFELTKATANDMMSHAINSAGALIAVAIGIGGVAAGIFFTVNTTGWDTTSKLVWPYIFVLSIAVILFGFLRMAQKGGD